MKHIALILACGGALAAATGCASSVDRSPDEFRAVTKAPLTVPPDYKLRPPPAGSTLPAEVDPKRAGVASAFGSNIGKNASASERALVSAAGANAVSPVVRAQVDYDETKTIRKNQGVVDRVLFWRKDNAEDAASAIDDNATGGEAVTIERASGTPRLKLPGT